MSSKTCQEQYSGESKEMGVYFSLKTEERKMSRIRRREFWSGAGGTGSQESNFYNYFTLLFSFLPLSLSLSLSSGYSKVQ